MMSNGNNSYTVGLNGIDKTVGKAIKYLATKVRAYMGICKWCFLNFLGCQFDIINQ